MQRPHRTFARILTTLVACMTYHLPAHADEGMWPVDAFPVDAFERTYGVRVDADVRARLQAATLRLGSATASLVSAHGLLMANHHSVMRCLERVSTETRDVLRDGYYASRPEDELPCPASEATQLLSTEDVTGELDAAVAGTDGDRLAAARRTAIAAIEARCVDGSKDLRCTVVPLFQGAKYVLHRQRVFRDLRLVFAPESEIGSFGGDPDNFEYPRTSLDLAFLRVYEGGRPYRPAVFLPFARTPATAGTPVLAAGHPVSTRRGYTVAQLELLRDDVLPWQANYLSEFRGLLVGFAGRGARHAAMLRDVLWVVENDLKIAIGHGAALRDPALFAIAERREAAVRGAQSNDGSPWAAIEAAAARERQIHRAYAMLEEQWGFRSRLLQFARQLVRHHAETAKPSGERLPEYRDEALAGIRRRLLAPDPIHVERETALLAWSLTKLRETLGADDPTVRLLLGSRSAHDVAAEIAQHSRLADVGERRRLLEVTAEQFERVDDPALRLMRRIEPAARAVRRVHDDEVRSVLLREHARIARARLQTDGGRAAPDAAGTLRLTYGSVAGHAGVRGDVPAVMTIGDLYARATGAEPYALPRSWLEARSRVDESAPFNFAATLDITGGNSGSPVVNARGHVVGLVFDHNAAGFGGEFVYDATRNRAVAVAADGIRAALRDVYRAERVLREIEEGLR